MSMHDMIILLSHLRRCDFRYTTILFTASYYLFVRASGEAILGTQRYFSQLGSCDVTVTILGHNTGSQLLGHNTGSQYTILGHNTRYPGGVL